MSKQFDGVGHPPESGGKTAVRAVCPTTTAWLNEMVAALGLSGELRVA